ncbi:MAG: exonuclease SbcCD subunit D [Acidobacteriota bacterium]
MQPFSFLHCGDVHLGAPFRGLAETSPAMSQHLRDAPASALEHLISKALEQKVAALLVAGDLFDADDRNLRAQIQLRDQLERLHAANIPTFIAAGNHDPLGGRLASIRYPSSVSFFGTEVEAVPLHAGGSVAAHVYGISYSQPEVRENLVTKFPRQPQGPFAIAVLHTNVGDHTDHGSYAPCKMTDLQARRFDYWALGHVHTRETLQGGAPVIHYPGNLQGLHIKETGPRGATLVDVTASGAVSLTPVWTDTVRWHRRRTPIDNLVSLDDLMGAFSALAGEIASEAPERLHILRWTLTDQGPLHAELRRRDTVHDLVEALRAEHAPEPDAGSVWLERLDLATRPARDLEALRQQQDLLGDLLRLAQEARDCPPAPPTREIGGRASPHPQPGISVALRDALCELLEERRIRAAFDTDPWALLDWPRLIGRAETLAVDMLAGVDAE